MRTLAPILAVSALAVSTLAVSGLVFWGATRPALAEAAAAERGFAGLGAPAAGFAQVTQGRPIRFPQDYGQHPDYRIEWWYITANLQDRQDRPYGVQWTLFRQALAPSDNAKTEARDAIGEAPKTRGAEAVDWSSRQVWMAHIAATSAETHRFEERVARGGAGQAGVHAAPFKAWLDDWSMQARGEGLERLSLTARGADFGYALELSAEGPITLHGDAGYSVKSGRAAGAPQASYYYSQPHYRVSGVLELKGKRLQVKGDAWLDREWSSQPLAPDQIGWDWFALRFENGEKLMLFQLRRADGGAPDLAGSLIDAQGRVRPVAPASVRLTPLGQSDPSRAPTRWRIALGSINQVIEIEAVNPQAWQDGRAPYWEGPVTVSGDRRGVGFLEMTGYAR